MKLIVLLVLLFTLIVGVEPFSSHRVSGGASRRRSSKSRKTRDKTPKPKDDTFGIHTEKDVVGYCEWAIQITHELCIDPFKDRDTCYIGTWGITQFEDSDCSTRITRFNKFCFRVNKVLKKTFPHLAGYFREYTEWEETVGYTLFTVYNSLKGVYEIFSPFRIFYTF